MAARRVDRIGLTVSDTDPLARFYADAFGATVGDTVLAEGEPFARLHGVRDARARILDLRIGSELVELAAFAAPGAPYPRDATGRDLVFQHFALVTTAIDAAWGRALDAGARPIGSDRPVRLPARSGGVTAIKLRDPDGHPLELLAFDPDAMPATWRARAATAGAGVVLGIDHSAIAVSDTARSEAFFVGLLGFAVGHRSVNVGPEQEALDGSFNALVEVTALAPPDAAAPHVEFLCNRIPADGRPIPVTTRSNDIAATRLVIGCDDLDATIGALVGKQARFVSPHAVARPDGTVAASVCDPDGHRLVLATPVPAVR